MRFGNKYGYYELNPFPGNAHIVVSNHAYIYPEYRGEGHGKDQHLERLSKAKELGYSLIVCTVRADNYQEIKMLQKNGWLFRHEMITHEDDKTQLWTKDV